MPVDSETVGLHTRKESEIPDITERVQAVVSNGTIKNGVALLFVPGSTAALTTLEYEPGIVTDLPSMLERIAPKSGRYAHEEKWHDGNGHSHVRAALLGPDLSIPVRDGQLILGILATDSVR